MAMLLSPCETHFTVMPHFGALFVMRLHCASSISKCEADINIEFILT